MAYGKLAWDTTKILTAVLFSSQLLFHNEHKNKHFLVLIFLFSTSRFEKQNGQSSILVL